MRIPRRDAHEPVRDADGAKPRRESRRRGAAGAVRARADDDGQSARRRVRGRRGQARRGARSARRRGRQRLPVRGDGQRGFRGDARDFLERYGVTYPNVYDGKGSTIGRYGVTGYPETYFIDAEGRVRYRIAGPVESAEDIDDGIRRALAQA